jgi:putative oxygen-independent coproporphyrinogen III oxidase
MNHAIPLSLYIHLPWCVRKCPYCDFNSHRAPETLPETAYITALLQDLTVDLAQFAISRPLHTIFIGGGTPSLFSGNSIHQLIEGIHDLWPITNDTEITLEANPGTAEQQHFKDYAAAGVNRISLGAQSFQNDKLQQLGRIHQAEEIYNAVDMINAAGIKRFNIDLMYGLPGQSIADGLWDLQQAIDLAPTHLSWYQLTLEPNTIFYKKPPTLPHEDLIWDLQEQGQTLLAAHCYQQYEISAYCQTEHYCQHNLNYWQFGDYVGIGAGAHGKITSAAGPIFRTRKITQPNSYLATDNFTAQTTEISQQQVAFEYMLNALRLNVPITEEHFHARTSFDFTMLEKPLQRAQDLGLIHVEKNSLTKSTLGQKFLNNLLELFL